MMGRLICHRLAGYRLFAIRASEARQKHRNQDYLKSKTGKNSYRYTNGLATENTRDN